jgi:dienelactone hydrolase
VLCAAVLLGACASPSRHAAARIADLGFTASTVHGIGFDHLVVRSAAEPDCTVLRVYVEHDGTPWVAPDRIATDPTPRNPVALELMGRDTGCRVYVGRPCYFEQRLDERCDARWWTDRRYADEVVRSMAAVVNRVVAAEAQVRETVLIGYSGGGTIAWLMAPHVPSATAVVTVAANLDVRAWTEWHGYSPLGGSLDPAASEPLPARIRQWHLAGAQDRNVPPATVRTVVGRQRAARFVEIAGFDHVCCWVERWPQLLAQIGPPVSSR